MGLARLITSSDVSNSLPLSEFIPSFSTSDTLAAAPDGGRALAACGLLWLLKGRHSANMHAVEISVPNLCHRCVR
jgi:hypothetical protein